MYCCSNCFKDHEILNIINSNKQCGNSRSRKCDICGSGEGTLYEMSPDSDLSALLSGLVGIYSSVAELRDADKYDDADFVADILERDWDIFNLKSEQIHNLLTCLCSDLYSQQPDLFDSKVVLKEMKDPGYLDKHSIMRNYRWSDFLDGIKRKNRFHCDYINKDILECFIRSATKRYKAGKKFYRSRICRDEKGFGPEDMGAPPFAKAGRVNPEGISILYVSKDRFTTVYEVRAGIFDYVSVGVFDLLQDIEVVDLTQIERISPFAFDLDLTDYAINIKNLREISNEISKPLRNENVLDYLPTQYISDFIRSKGYSGIEYRSSLNKTGINLAIFDPQLLRCTGTSVYDIKDIKYDPQPIDDKINYM